jgi:hypothetical protein
MAILNFDANTVEPSSGFSPIPAGKYVAVITDDEMKDTRDGLGRYLQLTFEIIEGEYSGRKLWTRLNLENANMEAVKIARADLSAICRAVNVMQLKDSVELHNLPMVITVRLKKNKETDEMQNEIKGYESKQAYAPGATASAPAAQTATAPWARK